MTVNNMTFFETIKPLDLEELDYDLQQQEKVPKAEYEGTAKLRAFINELISKEELSERDDSKRLRTKLRKYIEGFLVKFTVYLDSSLLHPSVVLRREDSDNRSTLFYVNFMQQPEGGSVYSHQLDDEEYIISEETYNKALEFFVSINSRSLQYTNDWFLDNIERSLAMAKKYKGIL
jgi:hypothetical protein